MIVKLWKIVMIGSALLIAAIIIMPSDKIRPVLSRHPMPHDNVLLNPYMGFAAFAPNKGSLQPVTLTHLNIPWRELEPEKGKYAFDQLESRFHFDLWSSQGARFILRFILDYPGESSHMDIPGWLYEEMGHAGTWYNLGWGGGFSPDYQHPLLINYHKKLIQALGARYNHDPRIAFVQLGSIGHWGEWHTSDSKVLTIPFPGQAITDKYVQHYIEAFPDKKLLMRRPYPIAAENQFGLYNDAFGDPEQTIDGFLRWVNEGYTSWLTSESMPSMPDFWKYAPSGGEFYSTSEPDAFYNDDEMNRTIEMIKKTHMSWIGPYAPVNYPLNGPYQDNLDRIMKTLGYRFRVQTVTYEEYVHPGELLHVEMKWRNDGVAPFYYDWPIELSLVGRNGELQQQTRLQADIRGLHPGSNQITGILKLPDDLLAGLYELQVAILDPETGEPGVQLAMEGKGSDGRYLLGQVLVKEKKRWWNTIWSIVSSNQSS